MTLRTNARIAGFTFGLYFVAGISQLMLSSRGPANDLLTMVTAFSALVVVILPVQPAGLVGGSLNWASSVTWFVWLPTLVFELTLAAWLIVKGVDTAARRQSA